MRRRHGALVWTVLTCVGATLSAQPRTKELGPGESYVWFIRAAHSDEILMAAGDSVDVVLLRDRCGADAGHGQKGCWNANTVRVAPRWRVGDRAVARVRPLANGSWLFGTGAAGARIFARSPGRTDVAATLPSGETADDSVWVIAAPGAVRIVLEPKPREIIAGDTIRFRVTARDAADRIVAILPLPVYWNVVGQPDSLGYTPVAFHPWETRRRLVPRLGRLTDTLELHLVPRRTP